MSTKPDTPVPMTFEDAHALHERVCLGGFLGGHDDGCKSNYFAAGVAAERERMRAGLEKISASVERLKQRLKQLKQLDLRHAPNLAAAGLTYIERLVKEMMEP